MLPVALLPLVLTAHLEGARLEALAAQSVKLSPPLAELSRLLEPLRAPGSPRVEEVRKRLKEVRELEREARRLLSASAASGASSDRALVHLAMATAWGRLARVEEALAIEGEGDAAVRDAVREQAKERGDDAEAIALAEARDCQLEPGAAPAVRKACALEGGPPQQAKGSEMAVARRGELRACLQEHLLAGGAAPGPVTADLDLEERPGFKTISGVVLKPAPTAPWSTLAECLQTRLLGWLLTDDADEIELPIELVAPGNGPGP